MWDSLLIALALILIIEGMLPFLNPAGLRKSLLLITQMDDRTMRIGGLVSMLVGIALLYWVH
ncbi:MAG: DUF2065 domain-containing protein [Gammaproteobacteria bacterium]